jgi:hypothetical protein
VRLILARRCKDCFLEAHLATFAQPVGAKTRSRHGRARVQGEFGLGGRWGSHLNLCGDELIAAEDKNLQA